MSALHCSYGGLFDVKLECIVYPSRRYHVGDNAMPTI